MTWTRSGASQRRIDRWLRVYAIDLEPLDEGVRDLLRLRLAARRRASRPSMGLALLAVIMLFVALGHSLWAADPERAQGERVGWWLASIMLIEAGLLLRLHRARRADASIAAGLGHRVARGERVPLTAVLGRAGIAAAVASGALGLVWSSVLLALRAETATYLWALCIGVAVAVVVMGLRVAMNRPAVAVDSVSLAVDERMRAEEVSGAVMPLMLVWTMMSPVSLALQGVPRWADKGLAASTALVMLTYLWGSLQRASARPWPPASW